MGGQLGPVGFSQEKMMMKLICVSEGFEHAGKVGAALFTPLCGSFGHGFVAAFWLKLRVNGPS